MANKVSFTIDCDGRLHYEGDENYDVIVALTTHSRVVSEINRKQRKLALLVMGGFLWSIVICHMISQSTRPQVFPNGYEKVR